jgi:uncharacterized membrane protein YeiH
MKPAAIMSAMPDPQGVFQLPLAFDLGATFVSGLAGALAAARRQYDYVGVFALAFVTGLGGAVMRDSIFLAQGPPLAVRDGRYLAAVLAATLIAVAINQLNRPAALVVLFFDAVGLGTYAVVGADRALAAGLSDLGAILVGLVNAVGGGVLRDVFTREEPVLFKPGQYYATAAAIGSALYVGLRAANLHPQVAALTAGGMAILLRLLAVRYNWRTRPWSYWPDHGGGVG